MRAAVCLVFLASSCLGCILEDLRNDVNILNSTSSQLEVDVKQVQMNLENVEKKLNGSISSVSEQLEQKYDAVTDEIASNAENYIKLEETVNDIKKELNATIAQLHKKVGLVEENLEKKYEALENNLQAINKNLTNLDGVVEELQEDMEDKFEKVQEHFEGGLVELENKLEALEETQVKLEKRIGELEADKDNENGGTWRLGMNINPSDGHIFGYTIGWATGDNIGSEEEALTKDYLSGGVWDEPAKYIAIVRHQQGVLDAVKVFKFRYWGASLYTRFGTKNQNPGRQIVTKGGPIQESISVNATNLEDDPIFSVDGDLAFNWAFGDNGCRIVLTGGHLSGANENDDNTHGLGNNYYCNPITNNRFSTSRTADASVIQDCSWKNGCREDDVKVQGKDHGHKYKNGPVYGNYAIYVSMEAESFPLPGYQLDLEIEM